MLLCPVLQGVLGCFCTARSPGGTASRHALIKPTSDGEKNELKAVWTNQDVSFTSREGSAHHTKLRKEQTVQADCTVRSLQYVVTQYSTHVHMIEPGEESHPTVFLRRRFVSVFTPETKKLDNTATLRLHRNLDRHLPPASTCRPRRHPEKTDPETRSK